MILGNSARGDSHYARVPGQATSYLVDRNPPIPQSPGDWLKPDILDISASRVKRMSVAHADGETIVIEKTDEAQTDYDVVGIPEGRELTYATLGNAMAGALAGLQLDDVRKRVHAPAETSVTVDTWDGLTVSAEIVTVDEATWMSFAATGADSENADEAAAINERLSGWQYRVADHKKNLMVRRWDDILKAAD